jgi:hypothetical protein
MKRTKITNENYKLEYDGYSIDVTSDDKTKTKIMLNIKEEQRDFVKNIFPEISEMFKDKSFSDENSIENLINVSYSVAEHISGCIDNVNFIKIGTSEIGIERIHNMIKDSFSDINYGTLKTFESDEKMENRHQINEDKKDGTVDIFIFEMEKHKLFKFISINNDDERSFELWGNVDNNDLNKIKTSLSLVNEELLNKTKNIEIFPENDGSLKISLSDISEEGGQYSKLNLNIHNVLSRKDLEVKSFLDFKDISEAVLRTDIINNGTEYSNKRDMTDRYIQNFAEDLFLKSLNGSNFLEMGWTDIKLESGTIDEFNSIGEVFGTLMDISNKVPLCHSLTMDCLYEDFKMEYSEANTLEINENGNNITLTSNYTDTAKEKDLSVITETLKDDGKIENILTEISKNFNEINTYSCKVNGENVTRELNGKNFSNKEMDM